MASKGNSLNLILCYLVPNLCSIDKTSLRISRCKAKVKLTHIVGPTMCADTKVEPFDIPSQQCVNVCE